MLSPKFIFLFYKLFFRNYRTIQNLEIIEQLKNFRNYRTMLTLFFFIFPVLSFLNIIKNGDLQDYKPLQPQMAVDGLDLYKTLPSQPSQWYEKGLGPIEIKKKINVATTICLQLSTSYPVSLCQQIVMKTGRKHRLIYSVFNDNRISKANYTVTIDNILISSLYLLNTNSFQTKTDYFYPSFTENEKHEICFQETHYMSPLLLGIGGLIDNISLVQAQLHQLSFEIKINENTSHVIIQSKLHFNESLVAQFQLQYILTIDGETFQQNQLVESPEGYFQIHLMIYFGFLIKQIQFLPRVGAIPNQMLNFSVTVNSKNIFFHNLTDLQKNILLFSRDFLQFISKQVLYAVNFLRFTTSSYFVLTLLNFENLILFYVFMSIRVVPQFTKQIYYQMLKINFDVNSISEWLSKVGIIKGPIFCFSQQQQKISNVVEKTKGGSMWFGELRISSLLYNNNIDFFISFGLLVVKVTVLKLVFKLFSRKKRKLFGLKFSLTRVLLVELIANIPSVIVGSLSRTFVATVQGREMMEKAALVFVTFVCISSIPIYWTLGRVKRKKEKLKYIGQHQKNSFNLCRHNEGNIMKVKIAFTKNQNKKQKTKILTNNSNFIPQNVKKRQYNNFKPKKFNKTIQPIYDISDFIQIVSIPFLVTFQDTQLFMVANSFCLIFKIASFLSYSYTKKLPMRAIELLINLVWIFHHVVFFIFYIIETKKDEDTIDPRQKYSATIVLLGIIAILTVVVGFILEIMKFLLMIVMMSGKLLIVIKAIRRDCIESKKVYPKQKSEDNKSIKGNELKGVKKQPKQVIIIEEISEYRNSQSSVKKNKLNSYCNNHGFEKAKQKSLTKTRQVSRRNFGSKITKH